MTIEREGVSMQSTSDLMRTLETELAQTREQILRHPAGTMNVGQELLKEFALTQWGDSVVWVPMLATMRDRVRSPRLRKALDANLRCEAGVDAVRSHVTLCREFVTSLGMSPGLCPTATRLGQHAGILTDLTPIMSETQIAGWILASESLVPSLFSLMLPQFERVGARVQYLREHISVDDEEHAQWMREAAEELIEQMGEQAYGNIVFGLQLASRATISVLDALYALSLAQQGALRPDVSASKSGWELD